MLISAVNVKDFQKKDDLIHFANALGCRAVYSEELRGLAIETSNRKTAKEIEQKIKELEE